MPSAGTNPISISSLTAQQHKTHHACLTNLPVQPPLPQQFLASFKPLQRQGRGSDGMTNITVAKGADQQDGKVTVTQN